jgi:hypothetical protein
MSEIQHSEAALQGHLLRSLYLNEFAGIEAWVGGISKNLFGDKYKPAAPLSQKLNAIRSELKSEESRFQHRTHVEALIDSIAKFSERRAHMVHARLTVAQVESGAPLWLFRNCAYPDLPDNQFSNIESAASMTKAIDDLRELSAKLSRQKLREPKASTQAAPAATSAKS